MAKKEKEAATEVHIHEAARCRVHSFLVQSNGVRWHDRATRCRKMPLLVQPRLPHLLLRIEDGAIT